jgi:hypothetical protein
MLFADHFQFCVQDALTDETLPVHWEPEEQEALAFVGAQVIHVATIRELDVAVTAEISEKQPADGESLDDWDHVVECAISLPSGKLLFTSVSQDIHETQRLEVEPGTYGVRIYYESLDEVDDEGFEGEDSYRVRLWKTDDPPPTTILKQWTPRREFVD